MFCYLQCTKLRLCHKDRIGMQRVSAFGFSGTLDSISRQDIFVFRITRKMSKYDMGNKRRLGVWVIP